MDKEIINKLGSYFQSKPVKKAYLFGSTARGEQTENSDIDILLDLDYSRPIGLKFFKMHIELEELLNRKVDILTNQSISGFIKPYIDKDKVLIYER